MKLHFILIANLLQANQAFTFHVPQKNNNGISLRTGYKQIFLNPAEKLQSLQFTETSLRLSSSVDFTEAEDVKSIKSLFSQYSDDTDLMTKETLCKVPPFDEMLEVEDLSMEELTEIWDAAPKSEGDESRIGVDSFVQIYLAVDDLFEDDEEETESSGQQPVTAESFELNAEQTELKVVFDSLCDNNKLISKTALKAWDEIQSLMSENLLGESEFDDLWKKSAKSSEKIDLKQFLSFNSALDDLFEDDEGETNNELPKAEEPAPVVNKKMVEGDGLPPGVLFAAIADENFLVGMDELKLWVELQEMLKEGDLLLSELQSIYDSIGDKKSGKLNEEGFVTLYEKIDALFEDEVEDEAGDDEVATTVSSNRIKKDLLNFIDLIENDDEEALRCCLDSTEEDQKQVLNIVTALEAQPTNLIKQKSGNIDAKDLTGTWELIYSSSSAMKFNKGLSGIGGSFPNGRFGGLKQKLTATKYVKDVEYKEWIEVKPSPASFYVSVTGSWDLKTSMSLFTGEPSILLNIEPDRVEYGPTSTRADHWKSLGPTNLLDLTYLDDNFRVMRGCTSTDTIFLYKRVADD